MTLRKMGHYFMEKFARKPELFGFFCHLRQYGNMTLEKGRGVSLAKMPRVQQSLPHMEDIKDAVGNITSPSMVDFFNEVNKFPKKQVPQELEPLLRAFFSMESEEIPEKEKRTRMNQFESAIRELMTDSADALFGMGEEGAVYRFAYGEEEFVVVKRRFDSSEPGLAKNTKNEYESQKLAHQAAAGFTAVTVPAAYARIKDKQSECEYIVMEHVNGKTIDTLLYEQVLNYEFIPLLEGFYLSQRTSSVCRSQIRSILQSISGPVGKISDEQNTGTLSNFYAEREDLRVQLTDTTAMKVFLKVASFLKELGCMGEFEFPDRVSVNPNTGRQYNAFTQKHLERAEKNYPLVSQEDGASLRKSVATFVEKMHRSGVYHNDGHTGNIMINDRGQIVIIDFGRGTKKLPNPSEPWAPKPDSLFEKTAGEIGSTPYGHSSMEVRKTNYQLFRKILPIVDRLEIPYPIVLRELTNFVEDLDFSNPDGDILDLVATERYPNDERVSEGKTRLLIYFARCTANDRAGIREVVNSWDSGAFAEVKPDDFQERKERLLGILDQFNGE